MSIAELIKLDNFRIRWVGHDDEIKVWNQEYCEDLIAGSHEVLIYILDGHCPWEMEGELSV